MAWPTVVKLSGIDEGHSVLVLQQKKIELVEVDFLTLLAGPVLERQARARADAAAGAAKTKRNTNGRCIAVRYRL